MRAQDSDARLSPCTRINAFQQLSNQMHIVLREAHDRWAGTAQTDAKKVRVLDVQQVFQTGNERLPIRLVETVL